MVYAIADLHGDYDQAIAVLRLCGLIAADGSWAGGNATLVQTGDLVDRGPDSLKVLELFRTLRRQAAQAGGRVVTLLGNHEALNLEGDFRYVNEAELQSTGRETWSEMFDPEEGAIGAELRGHEAAVVAGEGACRTLFVHAGLRLHHLLDHLRQSGTASTAAAALDALNERMRLALGQARSRPYADLTGDDGPLWRLKPRHRTAPPARAHPTTARRVAGTAASAREQRRRCAARCARRCRPSARGAWSSATPSCRTTPSRCLAAVTRAPLPARAGCSAAAPPPSSPSGGMLHMLDVGMSRAYYGSLAAWRCQQLGGGWAAAVPLHPPAAYLSPQAAVAPLQVVYVPEGGPLLAAEEALVGGSLEALPLPPSATAELAAARRRRSGDRALQAIQVAGISELCSPAAGCLGLSVEGGPSARGGGLRGLRSAPDVFEWRAAASAARVRGARPERSGAGVASGQMAQSPNQSVLAVGVLLLIACTAFCRRRGAKRQLEALKRDPSCASIVELETGKLC